VTAPLLVIEFTNTCNGFCAAITENVMDCVGAANVEGPVPAVIVNAHEPRPTKVIVEVPPLTWLAVQTFGFPVATTGVTSDCVLLATPLVGVVVSKDATFSGKELLDSNLVEPLVIPDTTRTWPTSGLNGVTGALAWEGNELPREFVATTVNV
jgi:hypothetical protein